MNTQVSTKLAALSVALIMNSALICSVAFLFNGQVSPSITLNSAHVAAPASAYLTVNARI